MRSIVGRFLEHARIYYFHNGGEPEVFIGSADLMERNLDRRIEALAPVLDKKFAQAIHDRLLVLQLADNVRTTILQADGLYVPVSRADSPPIDAQLAWTESGLELSK